jgi:putative oxidoreductase
MKKIFSTRYSETAFDLSMFLLRAGFGLFLFLKFGLSKMMKFEEMQNDFADPFHIGHTLSLLLVIFAEVFCSVLLVMGLLSRLASFVLVILFIVIIFVVNKDSPVKENEKAFLYLFAFLTTLLCGPGKWSIDKLIGK